MARKLAASQRRYQLLSSVCSGCSVAGTYLSGFVPCLFAGGLQIPLKVKMGEPWLLLRSFWHNSVQEWLGKQRRQCTAYCRVHSNPRPNFRRRKETDEDVPGKDPEHFVSPCDAAVTEGLTNEKYALPLLNYKYFGNKGDGGCIKLPALGSSFS